MPRLRWKHFQQRFLRSSPEAGTGEPIDVERASAVPSEEGAPLASSTVCRTPVTRSVTLRLTVISPKATQSAASATSLQEDKLDIAGPIDEAHRAISSRHLLGEGTQERMEAIEPATEAVESTRQMWEPVLEKVEIFANLVESIGEVRQVSHISILGDADEND